MKIDKSKYPKLFFLPLGIKDSLEAHGKTLEPLLTVTEIKKTIDSGHEQWLCEDSGTILAKSNILCKFPFSVYNDQLATDLEDGARDKEALIRNITGNLDLYLFTPQTAESLTGYISEDNEAIIYFTTETKSTSLLEDLLRSLTITKSIDRAIEHPLWQFLDKSYPIEGSGAFCGSLSSNNVVRNGYLQ